MYRSWKYFTTNTYGGFREYIGNKSMYERPVNEMQVPLDCNRNEKETIQMVGSCGMCLECHKIAYPKLHCAGLHLKRENQGDLVSSGGELQDQRYSLTQAQCVPKDRWNRKNWLWS
jgi:hypothetical protein